MPKASLRSRKLHSSKNKFESNILKPRLSVMYIAFLAYLIVMSSFIAYHIYFAGRIVPGVFVNDVNVGGKTAEGSIDLLRRELKPAGGVTIKVGDSYSTDISSDDIEFRLLYVETTRKAFEIGRTGNLFDDFHNKIAWLKGNQILITPAYDYDEVGLLSIVSGIKTFSVEPVQEPVFNLDGDTLVITDGRIGQDFNEKLLIDNIIDAFIHPQSKQISVNVFDVEPSMAIEDLDSVQAEMQSYVKSSYVLTYEDKKWEITPEETLGVIVPVKDGNGSVRLDVNKRTVLSKLENISLELNQNPRGQVLEVEGSRAVTFVPSQKGLKLKLKENVDNIADKILNKEHEIALIVQITNPPVNNNKFGIRDILGVGVSKFKGSAKNRTFNIGLAASRVGGTLVPPGENFSFNEAVGEISRDTGYTSAWVISKGRTVLGDGGGVCQVSTTVFRAAINAGLPIVERHAHSYRVSYYEQDSPVGIDATIYRPSVDLKFKNDTSGYILVAAEFNEEDHSLKFTIFGTSDGRKVEVSEPKVLSRSQPPAPVYEEDPSLPKGKTVRVESPVWGASVVFNRKVSRGGEILYDDTFKSNYRAWGAVYKIGTQ